MDMEETAVQQERETEEVTEATTGSVDEVLGQSMEETIAEAFPSTPAPARPVPAPQAHRGRITGVTAETSDGGTRYLKVSYKSLETAGDDNLTIFPPAAYVENVLIDPSDLSTETPINASTGKPTMSDRQKFANSIRNSGKGAKEGATIGHSTLPSTGEPLGDGTVETLIRFAREQGHKAVGFTQVPQTFEQLAAYLNALTTGTDVVALLLPQGGDGDFADRLRTKRFVSQQFAEEILKTYDGKKGYRRLWLGE